MMASWLSGKVILVLFSNDCLCISYCVLLLPNKICRYCVIVASFHIAVDLHSDVH